MDELRHYVYDKPVVYCTHFTNENYLTHLSLNVRYRVIALFFVFHHFSHFFLF